MVLNLTEFISVNAIKQLVERLINLRESRDKSLEAIGKVFGDPIELAKYYIQPKCQNANPANEDEDNPVSVVTSPAFETINNFLIGDFARKGDGSNQFFILADAGMGKTSLLMMLRLAHLTSFWPKNYKCELLKLGNDTIDRVNKINAPTKTVLLLDALDEDPLAWGNLKNRLVELLQHTTNFKRVVITCRTQFFPNDEVDPFNRIGNIKIGGYICPMIFLSLFSDDLVVKYLSKRFETKSEQKKAVNIVKSMGSLRFRPLLLSYIDAFLESEIKEWNEFQIYSALINAWLIREENKLCQLGINVSHKDLESACFNLAKEMQLERTRVITKIQLSEMKRKHPGIEVLEKVDLGGRSLLNLNSDGEYRFAHYSIQEYFVSYGVINNAYDLPEGALWITDLMAEFISKYRRNRTDLKVLDFEGANIPPRINFANSDLSRINFNGSNMYRVNMSNCNLKGATFHEANLVQMNFSGSDLSGANLSKANLSGANMRKTNLTRTSFIQSRLTDVDFSDAKKDNAFITPA